MCFRIINDNNHFYNTLRMFNFEKKRNERTRTKHH